MMALTTYFFFFFNDTATTEIYTLSLHDALPILAGLGKIRLPVPGVVATRPVVHRQLVDRPRHQHPAPDNPGGAGRSEEHTSELQSQSNLVCRLLLEKKKNKKRQEHHDWRKRCRR